MISLAAKNRWHFSIFVLSIALALCAVMPVYRHVSNIINETSEKLLSQVEDLTGLSVDYEKFSPLILNSVKIRGVSISDKLSGNRIFYVRSVGLRYSLMRVIKRDWLNVFNAVAINGVEIDFDSKTDMETLARLSGLFSKEKEISEIEKEKTVFHPENFSARIPVAIVVRGAVFHFSNPDFDGTASIRRAAFNYSDVTKDLRMEFSSFLSARLKNKNFSVSTFVNAEGTLTDGFKNSLLLLRLARVQSEQFTLGNINMLLSYEKNSVMLRSVQNFVPLSLVANYSFDDKILSVNAQAERLVPLSVISWRGKNAEMVSKFSDVVFTGKLGAKYDIGTAALAYSSDGSVYLPDAAVKGSLRTRFAFNGNKSRIIFSSLNVNGEYVDASFSGLYRFASMQVDGSAFLRQAVLPNGNTVSGDFYFSPLTRGFECFSPEILLGEKKFTAFEMYMMPAGESIDFHAGFSDFLHYESGSPGTVNIDGTYIVPTKYFQSSLSMSNMYFDSMLQTAAALVSDSSGEKIGNVEKALSPYVLSMDIYVSGDMGNITYNVPYLFVANTTKENEAALLSVDGTNSLVRISRLNLLAAGQQVTLSGQADVNPDLSGGFFSTEIVMGNVPYRFSGSVYDGFLNVTGDYGFDLQVHRSIDGSAEGSFLTESFPVPISDAMLLLSCDTEFSYSDIDGPQMSAARLEISESGNKLEFMPRLLLAGNVSRYGAFFESVSYSDRYSSLEGNMSVFVNKNDDIFSSARIETNLGNQNTGETLSLAFDISNPENVIISSSNFKNSVYYNGQFLFNNVGISRFLGDINDSNFATGSVTAIGTVEHPFITATLEKLSGASAGREFSAYGSVTLEENYLSVNGFNFLSEKFNLNNLNANFTIDTFTGTASAVIDALPLQRSLIAPVKLTVSDTEFDDGSRIPKYASILVSSDDIGGNLFTKKMSAEISAVYGEDILFVSSSENIGLSGWVDKSGKLSFSVPKDYPLSFNLNGNVDKRFLDLNFDDVHGDAFALLSLLDFPIYEIYGGNVEGAFRISGLTADPEFSGVLYGSDADFSLPVIVNDHIIVPSATLVMDHNMMSIEKMYGTVLGEPVSASLDIVFDRWRFDYVNIDFETGKNAFVPATLNVPSAVIDGDVAANLNMVYSQDRVMSITGDVLLQNAKGIVNMAEFASVVSSKVETTGASIVQSDIRLKIGDHVNINFEPLLRCVLVPGTEVLLNIDQLGGSYSAVGDVLIRTGEIRWLSRNFYLRNGSLKFLENREGIDPLMNLRAETRERDATGRDVRINMSVENQFFSDFTPKFTSIPAKSETEIQVLLGQIGVGDSSNLGDLLFATGDYVIQSTLGRTFENSLRELMNFDIFSIRTNIVQNALRQGFNAVTGNQNWNVGNFFDNSTVYIGKYLNSDIFVNALLRWTYDSRRIEDTTTAGGIVFHPEIGIELNAPFATIRWSVAPNIDALMNNAFVPSTALTLSWNFSF